MNTNTETKPYPRHIALILDGNGRYAKKHGLLRQQGHKAGADNVEAVGDLFIEKGIPYMTVYAFSTENWKRSEDEVSYLMALMKRYLTKNKVDALRKGIRIRVIGDRSRLSRDLQELIVSMEEDTKDMKNLNLTFAINYGGRDEIRRAVFLFVMSADPVPHAPGRPAGGWTRLTHHLRVPDKCPPEIQYSLWDP